MRHPKDISRRQFLTRAGGAAIAMPSLAAILAASRGRIWVAIGYPVGAAVFVFILIDSTWRTLRRGGIEWRGTFYPLAALKANDI